MMFVNSLLTFSFILNLILFCLYYPSLFRRARMTWKATFSVRDYENETQYKANYNMFELNNFGSNVNLPVLKDRQRDANVSELKYILMWNQIPSSKKMLGSMCGREVITQKNAHYPIYMLYFLYSRVSVTF